MKLLHIRIGIIAMLLTYLPLSAPASDKRDLTGMPLESLMELTVTSVSKKSQLLTTAAAAVFVITQEDIRRSGVTSIPEALRMAPGIQVARIDSSKWAITARGLNGRFANKLLVLMDGRSLYTPFFSGVYWEVQDTVMEDIDRIEIIRGPGAALWGVNAVNGVINIITKSAAQTRGGLVSAGSGTYERGFATGRYGASLGEHSDLRLYAKHQDRDSFVDADGNKTHDAWQRSQGGFRYDSQLSARDSLTIQGDYYDGRIDETYNLYRLPTPTDATLLRVVDSATGVSGGNVLTRWQRSHSESENLSLQMYYDHTERSMLVSPQKFNVIDLDFQNRFQLGNLQDIVWGAGYRYSQYQVANTPTISFTQTNVENHIFSTFVHDEIILVPEKLSLILGSRFEHNNYSGFDVQPNGRLIWTPQPNHTVWGAVSRAVRALTRGEQDIHYNYRTLAAGSSLNPLPIPLRLEIVGNRNFKSEELIAYEVGYRTEPIPQLSIDVTFYYNIFNQLRVITPGSGFVEPVSGPPANAVQPYYLSNDMHGHAFGSELVIDWIPLAWWRLQAAYSLELLTMFLDGTSTDTINKGNAQGDTPRHQFSVRSGFDIGRQITLDLWLRGVDRLASIDGVSIPGYVTLDARLAWKPSQQLEFSLVGQNLLSSQHAEFIPEYVNTRPSETVRSMYGKITWKF